MAAPKASKKQFRMPLWGWIGLGALVLGGGIAWYVTAPVHASWRYGACRAFLEQYVRFPTSIKITVGGETRSTAIIGFADINPYGSEQIRTFECHYSQTPDGRVVLSKVTMDRKTLPEDRIKAFSAQLPLLATQELETELPGDLPSSLKDLKD